MKNSKIDYREEYNTSLYTIDRLNKEVAELKRWYEIEKKLFDVQVTHLKSEVERFYRYHQEFWNNDNTKEELKK